MQPRLFSIETSFQGEIRGHSVHKVINDICVIARLVGMPVPDYCNGSEFIDADIVYGERLAVNYFDVNKDAVAELFVIKFFKNGNQHLFLHKDFILRLNILIGKLCGWVNSANDAYSEMKNSDCTKKDFEKMYKETQPNSLSLGYTAEYLIAM